jgi:membrane fusion protein, multidrug efflux system
MPSVPDPTSLPPIPAAHGPRGRRPPRRRSRGFQRAIVVLLVLVGAVFGGLEIRERITHVTETDARIAAELITVSSRVAGWVTTVAVREGERVERGQVLAAIDDRESQLLVRQLEAQVQAARAEGERLEAERELTDAQTRSRLEGRRSGVVALEAGLESIEAQIDLARAELARAESLRDRRVLAEQQVDQARAVERRLESEYRALVAELEQARGALEEARAERARLAVIDRILERLGHETAELGIRLEQQRLDLSDRVIRSPVDGVVDRTFVDPGEYVSPGQRLAVVHDPRRIWVDANVKETQIRRLRPGQAVRVRVDAYPDEDLEGRIESIGTSTTASFALLPNPNPSGNFTKITQRLPVRIALDQEGDRLRPGMMVTIKIDVRDGR